MHFDNQKDSFCLQKINITKEINGSYSLNIKITPTSEEIVKNNCVLTQREKEILKLVIQGKNNTEIAKELIVSTNTVKAHLTNIFQKMSI